MARSLPQRSKGSESTRSIGPSRLLVVAGFMFIAVALSVRNLSISGLVTNEIVVDDTQPTIQVEESKPIPKVSTFQNASVSNPVPVMVAAKCEGTAAPQNNTGGCCGHEYCTFIVKQTSLFLPCCNAYYKKRARKKKIQVFRLLITGTPRSGTTFGSRVLTKVGLLLAHDAQVPIRDGIVSWSHLYQDYESLSWTRTNKSIDARFRHVIHQVRDPLKCITSMAYTEPMFHKGYLKFLSNHVHISDTTTLVNQRNTAITVHRANLVDRHPNQTLVGHLRIQRTLEFYIGWHRNILKLGALRYRFEDFMDPNSGIIPHLVRLANPQQPLPSDLQIQQAFNGTNTNARAHRQTMTWNELCRVHPGLTKQLLELSHEFGYYQELESVC